MAATDLATLLSDLRRQKAIVTPQELEHRLPPALPTGVAALDALLGGGFPEGRITELAGPGSTALAAVAAAALTRGGRLAAWIDRPDALDPHTATAAGVDLSRMLWCRPASRRDALRAADVLLASRAFALVVLDLAEGRHAPAEAERPPAPELPRAAPRAREIRGELRGRDRNRLRPELVRVDQEARPVPAGPPARASVEDRGGGLKLVRWAETRERPRGRRPDADPTHGAWLRLARDAEDARAALLVLGGGAGTFAALTLRASRARPRFSGKGPGRILDGLTTTVALERSKLGLTLRDQLVHLDAPALLRE